jgi:hypothetical protein
MSSQEKDWTLLRAEAVKHNWKDHTPRKKHEMCKISIKIQSSRNKELSEAYEKMVRLIIELLRQNRWRHAEGMDHCLGKGEDYKK